ncbi:MAG: NAD(P)/FAD-dependent oxidoreductase [Verrucomicrobia bacterium]|nr:NAD(P)/FAD-dependent oxidoreductase [Verrucomicrobiota bacterium]
MAQTSGATPAPTGTVHGTTQTVILGGGFGGLAAANTLRRALPRAHAVTVIDPSRRFLVGAGKTWVMLGERKFEEISADRARLLEPGVALLSAEATAIDLAGRTVQTTAGPVRWDYLVIAMGAALRLDAVPGLDGAHTFYTVEGAEQLRTVLAGFAGGEIALLIPKAPFKCPPAPYEAALLLHEYFAKRGRGGAVKLNLYTVEGTPMATAGPEMGQYIRGELASRGIGFFTQKAVARVDQAGRKIEFADGSNAAYDLLIAVPPHEAPAIVKAANLLGPSGWIAVDPRTLEIKAAPAEGRVYAIGDITSVPLPGRFKPEVPLSLPKAGVMAAAQGEVVGQRIASLASGQTPTAAFAGEGFCYLELGGACAVKANGAFFSLPHPVMSKQPPSREQLADKLAWVARSLAPRR